MEPIKRRQLEHHIYCAAVEFSDTGESKTLETKEDSVCHFFEPFHVGNDVINFRLDWSDIDENGNPTLDADFRDKDTNKIRHLKGERRDAHHTPSTGGKERIYCWEFKDCKRPFKLNVGWLLSATATIGVNCTVSLEVKRSTDESSKNEF